VSQDPEPIRAAARDLFERLRGIDYARFLARPEPRGSEGFESISYMCHTRADLWRDWVCRTFQDNPVVSIKIGDVFTGTKQVYGKTGWPTVSYTLTLQDGAVLEGDLAFRVYRSPGRRRPLARDGRPGLAPPERPSPPTQGLTAHRGGEKGTF